MTFEETINFLRDQKGRMIEIGIGPPADDDPGYLGLATVSGKVDRVVPGGGQAKETGDVWRVWFDSTLDLVSQVTLRRDLFESAEVAADQPPPEERNDSGTTWTLTIRQAGFVFDALIYV